MPGRVQVTTETHGARRFYRITERDRSVVLTESEALEVALQLVPSDPPDPRPPARPRGFRLGAPPKGHGPYANVKGAIEPGPAFDETAE